MKYKFKHLLKIGYNPYEKAGDYFYDSIAGDKVVNFFKNELTLTKGQWKGKHFIPFGWAEDVIRCLFGWKHKKTKLRRYSTAFIYVPRKNAKSEICAAIADYEFFTGNEPDNEIYIGARDRGQALTLWKMAEKMTQQNPALANEVDPHKTTKEILARWDESKIQAVSSDAMSSHSLSPGMVIIDELHAQRNNDLIEALTTGMGARLQPMVLYLTTADLDRPSVCNDEHEYAKSIRDNPAINLSYLPVIYEADKNDDWTDEEVWKKVNPSYPVTPSKAFLKQKLLEAKKSLRKEFSFKRLYLNMKTTSIEGWLNMDYWRLGNEDFSEDDMAGEECYLSFDLASKTDLCATALFFPEHKRLVLRVYCPQMAIDNDLSGYYEEWVDDGELIISGDKITDYRYIRADIEKFDKKFNINGIAYDPHNANTLIAELLDIFSGRIEEDENFMVEFTQTYRNYCDPAKEFEAMIIDNTLKHNSRVLDWMAANVIIKEGPSGDIMPRKKDSKSPLKIDGIIASIMAIGVWLTNKGDEEESGELRAYNLEDFLDDDE